MNNNRLVDRYSTFHIEISQKWIMFQAKKNRNKRNRTCTTMCASWVLGKSRHSCFSSIKKLLWFIGVENTLSVSLSSVTYQFQHGVVAYLRFSFHVKIHEMASWWLFSTTDHHTWRWGEIESAIERKMQYFPIANRFDRMHHSTLKWADTKRKYTCVDMEMLGSK